MRVRNVPLLLGIAFTLGGSAALAQGMAEYGGVQAGSAAQIGALNKGAPAMGGAFGAAFGAAVNQLNTVGGASGGVAAGKRGGAAAPALNGMTKEGNYDPGLAAQQAATYSNKLFTQAQLLEKAGKPKDAEPLYRKALYYRESIWGIADPNVVRLYDIIGNLSKKRGDLPEAEKCYKAVLMAIINRTGQGSYELVPILSKLGEVYNGEKKYSDAVKEYDQIFKLEERKRGAQDPKTIQAAINLAKVNLQSPETVSDAADVMKSYVEMLDKDGSSNPALPTILDTYALALRKQDKADLADKVQARADELRNASGVAKAGTPAKDDGSATTGSAAKKDADSKAAQASSSKDSSSKDAAKDSSAKESGAKESSAKESTAKDTKL